LEVVPLLLVVLDAEPPFVGALPRILLPNIWKDFVRRGVVFGI